MLSAAKCEQTLRECSEWIKGKKKNGDLKIATCWTAEDEFDNVAKIARAAGIGDEYEVMYDVTSKFIHCSPLMAYGYRREFGLNPLGDPKQCKQISSLGCMYVMNTLKNMAEFFQFPLDENDYVQWQQKFITSCADVLSAGWREGAGKIPPG